MKFSAVLLAAGHSIRMHRDKALLEREGVVMWQRQRDVLTRAGAEEVLLSARAEQSWADTAEGFSGLVRDAEANTGPLGGITAALKQASNGMLAVLAVDLPHMDSRWFETLLAECTPGVGAVGRLDGYFEPLAAIYPREILPLAEEALEARALSLQKLITTATTAGLMRVKEISETDRPLFANWNTPGSA